MGMYMLVKLDTSTQTTLNDYLKVGDPYLLSLKGETRLLMILSSAYIKNDEERVFIVDSAANNFRGNLIRPSVLKDWLGMEATPVKGKVVLEF